MGVQGVWDTSTILSTSNDIEKRRVWFRISYPPLWSSKDPLAVRVELDSRKTSILGYEISSYERL